MGNFKHKAISEHVHEFLDGSHDSFYLVCGSKTAAVIDTGVTPGETITPLIRRYTKLPLVLMVTHAHVDHFYHMDEFGTVYMSHKELTMDKPLLEHMMAGKRLDLEHTRDLPDGFSLDLGQRHLVSFEAGGHTPGSVVFWNPEENLVFTGDAVGSGCGVWMQIAGALPIVEYEKNLRHLLSQLTPRVMDNDLPAVRFFGGHNEQPYQSKLSSFNPLNLGLMADLTDMAGKVASGELKGEEDDTPTLIKDKTSCYVSYGRAEMEYRPDRVLSAPENDVYDFDQIPR